MFMKKDTIFLTCVSFEIQNVLLIQFYCYDALKTNTFSPTHNY